jgi:hypothetical protein
MFLYFTVSLYQFAENSTFTITLQLGKIPPAQWLSLDARAPLFPRAACQEHDIVTFSQLSYFFNAHFGIKCQLNTRFLESFYLPVDDILGKAVGRYPVSEQSSRLGMFS